MTVRHLVSIDDLSDEDASEILARASALANGSSPSSHRLTAALLFLSSSLRTKLGFGTAINRLGGSAIDVSEMRWDPKMSGAETFEDTLRTVTGMTDLTIVRAPVDLAPLVAEHAVGPVVCGGDLFGHPSQALIDVFAMERLHGPLESLRIAIVGDLTMRATRSLMQLLSRRQPSELWLVAPPSRRADLVMSEDLAQRTQFGTLDTLRCVDCVLMCGLTPRSGDDYLSDAEREPYVLTARRLDSLPPDAIVLSPLPVIDEIDAEARRDPRVQMFQQSDLSVQVRVAVIEHLLG